MAVSRPASVRPGVSCPPHPRQALSEEEAFAATSAAHDGRALRSGDRLEPPAGGPEFGPRWADDPAAATALESATFDRRVFGPSAAQASAPETPRASKRPRRGAPPSPAPRGAPCSAMPRGTRLPAIREDPSPAPSQASTEPMTPRHPGSAEKPAEVAPPAACHAPDADFERTLAARMSSFALGAPSSLLVEAALARPRPEAQGAVEVDRGTSGFLAALWLRGGAIFSFWRPAGNIFWFLVFQRLAGIRVTSN